MAEGALKERWENLSPESRRRIVVIGAAAGFLAVVSLLVTAGEDGNTRLGREEAVSTILTGEGAQEMGIEGIRRRLANNRDTTIELQNRLNGLEKKIARQNRATEDIKGKLGGIREAIRQLKGGPSLEEVQRMIRESTSGPGQGGSQKNIPLPDEAPGGGSQPSRPQGSSGDQGASAPKDEELDKSTPAEDFDTSLWQNPPELPKANPSRAPASSSQAGQEETEVAIRTGGAPKPQQTATQEGSGKGSKQQKQSKGVFVPAGSIFSGTLLSGLDAPTGKAARNDPVPILMRVKKEAILPNRRRADFRECFLLASGYGSLSSERVRLRAETISCIRDDGGVVESSIDMYAVGGDGKAGVRGRLVSKQGEVLGRSMVAGFMDGFSQLFSSSPVPTINTQSQDTTPMQSMLSQQSLESAALQGTGKALDRLAQFYIDMAEQMFPVIEVDAGRAVDFIVVQGTSLAIQNR